MGTARSYRRSIAAALGVPLAALLVLTQCTERALLLAPVEPDDDVVEPPPGTHDGTHLGVLVCQGSLPALTIDCGAPGDSTGGAAAALSGDLLYGGQNVFVVLTSSNLEYDADTHEYTFNVRIRNLIGQPIGTTDGTTVAGSGVRVFFQTLPTVTSGTGTITVANADGTATFTGSDQPFYRYPQVLEPFQQGPARLWRFLIPPTVGTFTFAVYISAPVQYEHGWIDTSHPTTTVRRTFERLLTATVRDQFGRVIPDATVTWSSEDSELATVTPEGGLVRGHWPGLVAIVAESVNSVSGMPDAVQQGRSMVTVIGTQLVWTAAAGTTDWGTPGNWDRNVRPAPTDSVRIPVGATYPALQQNEPIGRVQLDDGAQLSLGPFDLTASRDVTTGVTGGIDGTVGRLFLTGPIQTVAGVLPRVRVTGTYTATANLTLRAPLRVEPGGHLRTSSWRIRVTSF